MPERKAKSGDGGKKNSRAVRIIIGAAVQTALFFALLAVTAFAELKMHFGSGLYRTCGLGCAALSALICGFAVVLPERRKGFVTGLLSGLAGAVIPCAAAFLASERAFTAGALVLPAVFAVSSAVGGALAANIKRKGHVGKHG